MDFRFKFLTLVVVIFLSLARIVSAQKNDTVYLLNGDKVTGEIKKFDYGIITLKTDGLGTLSIEYDKVATAYSTKNFEIIDKAGFSIFGSVRKSADPGNFDLVISNGTMTKPIKEIVQMIPIKNIFWKKFYGSVDLGASYYKSTNILQYNFSTDINYRAKKRLIAFSLGSIYTKQLKLDSAGINKKNDISLSLNHYFTGKWWAGLGLKGQQNTELNLDYRMQLGFNAGYDIVRTNPVRFYTLLGLIANKEKALDTANISENLEALISLRFSWLQYRHPKINISSSFDFYPSITISGRYRIEYDLSAKYEIFRDLYLGVTFYDSYDSKQPSGGGALNDYGMTLSIGYTF